MTEDRSAADLEDIAQLLALPGLDHVQSRARVDLWELKWADFLGKINRQSDNHKGIAVKAILRRLVADSILSQTEIDLITKQLIFIRKKLDVLIVTVIPVEFDAVRYVFRDEWDKREQYWMGPVGVPVVTVQLAEKDKVCSVRVGICMIGRARNVSSALFCRELVGRFDPKFGILVGIAAGSDEKDKTGLVKFPIGSVCGSEGVFDFEGGAAYGDGIVNPELREYNLMEKMRAIFSQVKYNNGEWKKDRNRFYDFFRGEFPDYIPKTNMEISDPKFEAAHVAAGEKLRKDEIVKELKSKYNRKIMAVEMEGSGFAQAFDRVEVPWIVFRGISDYGVDKADGYQAVAAINAGLAAKHFIKYYLFAGE